ncbi:acyltransferase family protein [Planctomicrobium sp. SH527]|uniref:acyltransferase family protein n=1 Tax=Planctomicrobium sp. SH527 TaxID=3448123 RepID=UPI003F5B285C
MRQSKHIPILDPLRGIAALAVCFYHFTCGNSEFLARTDPIRVIGSWCWLGVDAFFVISGFVIPYALFQRSYTYRNSSEFLLRRFKRIEPPYVACIALVVLLHYISSLAPGFRGASFEIGWPQLLAHAGYLNAILGYDWLNPVFWTLAIEFQFYLFIAVIFPLLIHESWSVRVACLTMISLLGFLGEGHRALLIHWLPHFALGMLAFQFQIGKLTTVWFALLMGVFAICDTFVIGPAQSAVACSTALLITTWSNYPIPNLLKPLAFFGTISYSLYLIHTPIGSRITNLATRLPESPLYRYPAIILALGVSTVAAVLFWRFVERPSQRWSAHTGSVAKKQPAVSHAADTIEQPQATNKKQENPVFK